MLWEELDKEIARGVGMGGEGNGSGRSVWGSWLGLYHTEKVREQEEK